MIQPLPPQLHQTPAPPRIPELDAVRGLAILFVVIYHYLIVISSPQPGSALAMVHAVLDFGWAGVDLFFVLSGFLIGGILIKNREAENYFFTFYMRRAARLLPLYLLVVALYSGTSPLVLATRTEAGQWLINGSGAALPLWSYLLYVQNMLIAVANAPGGHWLAPTWSLAVEEQFYLIAPLLVRVVPINRLVPVLGLLIMAAIGSRTALLAASGSWIPGYVLLVTRWDALFIGILGALAFADPRSRARLEANAHRLPRLLGVLFAVFAILAMLGLQLKTSAMSLLGFTYVAVMSLAVIALALLVKTPRTTIIFGNAHLLQLGTISYGVYLLHMPVYGLICLAAHGGAPRINGPADAALALAAFATTLALADLSWRYFEKPVLDAASRFRYRSALTA